MSDQQDNIDRVSTRIAWVILEFFKMLLSRSNRRFFNQDLLSFVRSKFDDFRIAPDSPARIMRDLRAKGKINYIVVSRSASLYEALPLDGQESIG